MANDRSENWNALYDDSPSNFGRIPLFHTCQIDTHEMLMKLTKLGKGRCGLKQCQRAPFVA